MAIISLHHVSVLIKDLDHSLAFYQHILGLEVDGSRPDLGYPGAWLKVGEQQIHLMQLPDPDEGNTRPQHGGRDRHFALHVDDLGAIEKQLSASGIAYTLSKSGRRALFCRDPDGNAVELIQVSS